jgi:D-aminopeptidase
MNAPTLALVALVVASSLSAQATPSSAKRRARELGLAAQIGGTPGRLDAITDVSGVEVGHTTLVSGSGRLVVGRGPVRTGVTVIHPRGKSDTDPVMSAWFTLNGNGEMTGTTWIQESGFLEGPIAITNTHSVGIVRDAILQWQVKRPGLQPWGLPVVAETWDGRLNDINGFHVKPEHVFGALDGATGEPVREGNVGGGTGMVCYQFKCGTGTASRKLEANAGGYTVGVLVQANHGRRSELRIAGVPVGAEIPVAPPRPRAPADPGADRELGSIIIVVATDAPLLPHQLERIARRASLGLARTGATSGNGSGDIFIAFSTANAKAASAADVASVQMLSNDRISALFAATVQATEEAIVNALVAAETMTGANSRAVEALPHETLKTLMKKYGR